jgi:hypothetical protein
LLCELQFASRETAYFNVLYAPVGMFTAIFHGHVLPFAKRHDNGGGGGGNSRMQRAKSESHSKVKDLNAMQCHKIK